MSEGKLQKYIWEMEAIPQQIEGMGEIEREKYSHNNINLDQLKSKWEEEVSK